MAVTSVYFDAALIAKFYLNEPGRDAVRALAREMGRVVTSGVAVAEVSAAFHRKRSRAYTRTIAIFSARVLTQVSKVSTGRRPKVGAPRATAMP